MSADVTPPPEPDERPVAAHVTPASDTPGPEAARTRPVVEERMHPASPLVNMWLFVVALAWFAFTSFLQGEPIWEDPLWRDADALRARLTELPFWVYLIVGLPLLGLGFGYWGWWTTKFVIDDHEFRLENTGAFQESKRIAFGRIQSVDVTQPFAARVLGLAEVKIDVGAEDGTTLRFLRRQRATEIRDHLMSRAHGRRGEATPGRTTSAWDDSGDGDQMLIRLSPRDIIISAVLTQQVLYIALGALLPLILGNIFNWGVAAAGGLVPLAIALVSYLAKRLFGQFNYTLARTPAGLRITRGLTTLRSQTIPVHRVQALTISQPLPWRWINRARLHVTILGLGDLTEGEELSASTLYLPIGTPQQIQIAIAAIWPGLELERLTFTGPPARAKWLHPFQFSWMGHALDDRVIAIRTGFTERSQAIIPHGRVQAVRVSQGPLQRRLGLSSVDANTTSMISATVPSLDAGDARALAFAQLDRARASRVSELQDSRSLRATLVPDASGDARLVGPDAPPPTDVWLPPTVSLGTLTPDAAASGATAASEAATPPGASLG